MAHVELSLSESFVPQPRRPDSPAGSGPIGVSDLDRWTFAASGANEPCLVIDANATIVAASAVCHELLGLGRPHTAVGRFLLDDVIRLVDFTASRAALPETDLEKIPPLLALSSGRLARGLMRVYDGQEFDVTVDAMATPLYEGGTVVGSLTFFSAV